MLTVIPKESPAFATEHTHYFTQEAIIVNETCNNAYNFADLLIVQSTSSQSKTTPTQPIPLCQSKRPGHLASLLKSKELTGRRKERKQGEINYLQELSKEYTLYTVNYESFK